MILTRLGFHLKHSGFFSIQKGQNKLLTVEQEAVEQESELAVVTGRSDSGSSGRVRLSWLGLNWRASDVHVGLFGQLGWLSYHAGHRYGAKVGEFLTPYGS